jgi:N-glycosylase/DNA lyase
MMSTKGLSAGKHEDTSTEVFTVHLPGFATRVVQTVMRVYTE